MPLALLAAALLGQKSNALTPATKAAVVTKIGSVLRASAFVPGVDFRTWPEIVKAHREEIDDAATPDELAGALDAALAGYGVSHLGVSPPGNNLGERVHSFGFTTVVVDGKTIVTRVFDGTSAAREGLWPGMLLTGFEFPKYPDLGTIQVTIGGDSAVRTVAVERERFVPHERSPTLFWNMEGTCGILEVPSFMDYDPKAVERALRDAARFPNLILDLRQNSGGQPNCLAHLLGAFMPAGTRVGGAIRREAYEAIPKALRDDPLARAVAVRDLPSIMAFEAADNPVKYQGHIAVLIDGGTGSSAEIAALALREHVHAPIFGLPSMGAVLAANFVELPGGYGLEFPWRDCWTAKGERIEGHPIQPDPGFAPESLADDLQRGTLYTKIEDWLQARYPARPASSPAPTPTIPQGKIAVACPDAASTKR